MKTEQIKRDMVIKRKVINLLSNEVSFNNWKSKHRKMTVKIKFKVTLNAIRMIKI